MRGLDPIDSGHANIEQHDLRTEASRLCESFLAVCGLAYNLMGAEILDQLPQPVACRLLVINDQDSHVPVSSYGKRRLTLYAVGLSSTSSVAWWP